MGLRAGLRVVVDLAADDVAGPALWVDAGSEQLIVPLASEEAVRRVQLSIDTLRRVTGDGPRAQAYVFARRATDGSNTFSSDNRSRSRTAS